MVFYRALILACTGFRWHFSEDNYPIQALHQFTSCLFVSHELNAGPSKESRGHFHVAWRSSTTACGSDHGRESAIWPTAPWSGEGGSFNE